MLENDKYFTSIEHWKKRWLFLYIETENDKYSLAVFN